MSVELGIVQRPSFMKGAIGIHPARPSTLSGSVSIGDEISNILKEDSAPRRELR
jgi:hypothetical protein